MIVGGLAADGDRFARTWVLVDGVPTSGHVSAVGLCRSPGARRRLAGRLGCVRSRATRDARARQRALRARWQAGARALQGISGRARLRPAGDGVALSACDSRISRDRALRSCARSSPSTSAQSMTFAGDVPNGWRARLMRSNHDRLIAGAMRAASDATSGTRTQARACARNQLRRPTAGSWRAHRRRNRSRARSAAARLAADRLLRVRRDLAWPAPLRASSTTRR